MTAYNKLDGQFCSQNRDLTQRVLRQEWDFQGITMSDWFGTHATVESVKAGIDIEMPLPVFRGAKLVEAVKTGRIAEAEIDTLASRALQLRDRTRACLGFTAECSEADDDTNKLACEVAISGMVLLRNENSVLPLETSQSQRIAVVGEYAAEPVITGGGSASCVPQYRQSPLDALEKMSSGMIQYSRGVRTRRIIPMIAHEKPTSDEGKPGVNIKYYNKGETEPVLEESQKDASVWMLGEFDKKGLNPAGSRLEMSTKITPATSGTHTLAVRCTGAFLLSVNHEEVLSGQEISISTEQFIFNHILLESRVQLFMDAGVTYEIHLSMDGPRELRVDEPTPYAATLGFEEAYSEDAAIAGAVEIARSSDVTIIYAGRNDQYESEGFDLEDIRMPDNQTRLIKAVAAVSKKTIVVMHCGNPIDVSAFIEDVDALLLAHFPGQEGANATVDLLFGHACPSGRLATTWFKTLQDWPSYGHFPAKTSEEGDPFLRYAEGLGVGYRASNCHDRVRWPFGHGLSYTTFDHTNLQVVVDEDLRTGLLRCSLDVQNTGSVPGKETIQLFVCPTRKTKVWRPERELKGFTKILLKPGETQHIEMEIDLNVACGYWDDQERTWRLDEGEYGVVIENQRVAFVVAKSYVWNGL
ncbi:hypothetical protein FALCPG4_013812 [Fusarium falciforme]